MTKSYKDALKPRKGAPGLPEGPNYSGFEELQRAVNESKEKIGVLTKLSKAVELDEKRRQVQIKRQSELAGSKIRNGSEEVRIVNIIKRLNGLREDLILERDRSIRGRMKSELAKLDKLVDGLLEKRETQKQDVLEKLKIESSDRLRNREESRQKIGEGMSDLSRLTDNLGEQRKELVEEIVKKKRVNGRADTKKDLALLGRIDIILEDSSRLMWTLRIQNELLRQEEQKIELRESQAMRNELEKRKKLQEYIISQEKKMGKEKIEESFWDRMAAPQERKRREAKIGGSSSKD